MVAHYICIAMKMSQINEHFWISARLPAVLFCSVCLWEWFQAWHLPGVGVDSCVSSNSHLCCSKAFTFSPHCQIVASFPALSDNLFKKLVFQATSQFFFRVRFLEPCVLFWSSCFLLCLSLKLLTHSCAGILLHKTHTPWWLPTNTRTLNHFLHLCSEFDSFLLEQKSITLLFWMQKIL